MALALVRADVKWCDGCCGWRFDIHFNEMMMKIMQGKEVDDTHCPRCRQSRWVQHATLLSHFNMSSHVSAVICSAAGWANSIAAQKLFVCMCVCVCVLTRVAQIITAAIVSLYGDLNIPLEWDSCHRHPRIFPLPRQFSLNISPPDSSPQNILGTFPRPILHSGSAEHHRSRACSIYPCTVMAFRSILFVCLSSVNLLLHCLYPSTTIRP